jgi:cytochrome c
MRAFPALVSVVSLCACASTYVPPPDPIPVIGNELIGISGACADVQDGLTADGTPIVLFQCVGSPNQEWFIGNGWIADNVGSCVDVLGGAALDGAPIILVTCNGTPSQHWRIVKDRIIGVGGKCIDTMAGGTANLTPLILSGCKDIPSQSWTVQWSRAANGSAGH